MHCIFVFTIITFLHNSLHAAWFHELYVRWAFYTWFTHTPFAVCMQSMCAVSMCAVSMCAVSMCAVSMCAVSMCAVQKHWMHCKKSNFHKVLLTKVRSLNKSFFFVEVSCVIFFVWTEQKYSKHVASKCCFVYLTYSSIRYSSICSQYIQMFSQLFKLNHLNKQFYIEQYCTSSKYALQLENILCYLLLKYYNCLMIYHFCCCYCYGQLAVMWIRVIHSCCLWNDVKTFPITLQVIEWRNMNCTRL